MEGSEAGVSGGRALRSKGTLRAPDRGTLLSKLRWSPQAGGQGPAVLAPPQQTHSGKIKGCTAGNFMPRDGPP